MLGKTVKGTKKQDRNIKDNVVKSILDIGFIVLSYKKIANTQVTFLN